MKTPLAIISLALIVGATTSARAQYVGNGENFPREVVTGKDPLTRTDEVAQWMHENGAEHKSEYFKTLSDGTVTFWNVLELSKNNTVEMTGLSSPNAQGRKTPFYTTYCAMNVKGDTAHQICYNFMTQQYKHYRAEVRGIATPWIEIK